MNPKHHTLLMHYCALILQKDLRMDIKVTAYEPRVTFDANCVRNILQSSQSKLSSNTPAPAPARMERKRQQISMEAKGEILAFAKERYSHKNIALKFGMC
jgi:hypothetical protein